MKKRQPPLILPKPSAETLDIVQQDPVHCAAYTGDIAVLRSLLNLNISAINTYDDVGFCPLHYAVMGGDFYAINVLIARGAEVNKPTLCKKQTPMHLSAKSGKLNCMKHLRQNGGDIVEQDESADGKAPIHLACKYGHVDIVRWLLENGVSVNQETRTGMIPLYYPIERSNVKLVRTLLRMESVVNVRSSIMGGFGPLHSAVKVGNVQIVSLLLQSGANLSDFCTREHLTPIHLAAKLGRLDILRKMAEFTSNFQIRTKDTEGNGPIHLAVSNGFVSTVKWFLGRGVSVNCTNKEGMMPLHHAAYSGQDAMILFLVAKGAKVNACTKKPREFSPLCLAALNGKVSSIKLLVQQNASVNMRDRTYRYSALHYAVQSDNLECLTELCDAGGDLFMNIGIIMGESLLFKAAKHDSYRVAKWLIEEHGQRDSPDVDGYTALHCTANRGSQRVARLIIDSGAVVNCQNSKKRTPLHCSILAEKLEITKLLLDNNASANIYDFEGMNSVHHAAFKGAAGALDMLKAAGGNIFAPSYNKYADLPIHIASLHGHEETLAWFLDNQVPANLTNNLGYTPLMHAIIQGFSKCVSCLLSKGADLKLETHDGKTALHLAAYFGHSDLVRAFIEIGLDLNSRTKSDDRTPLHLAARNGHLDVVKILVNLEASTMALDIYGMMARDVAADAGKVEVVAYLSLPPMGEL